MEAGDPTHSPINQQGEKKKLKSLQEWNLRDHNQQTKHRMDEVSLHSPLPERTWVMFGERIKEKKKTRMTLAKSRAHYTVNK